MSKKKMVENLQEFLAARGFGGDEPGSWARSFYNYTACGPWTVFLVKGAEAFTRNLCFAVGRGPKGKLEIKADEEGIGLRDSLEKQDLLVFGFDDDRTIPRSLARTLKAYRKLVEDFAKEPATGYRIAVSDYHPHAGVRDPRRIWVTASMDVPAEELEVYYEKVWEDQQVTNENCLGIKIGSIVEGSDFYSGPFVHYFPFAIKDFERSVEYMESETEFYWERDNSAWYHVRRKDEHSDQYSAHEVWGDIKWDSDKPRSRKLKEAITAFLRDPKNKDYEYLELPGMPEWEIAEYVNSGVF
jgi:hypothetical protein